MGLPSPSRGAFAHLLALLGQLCRPAGVEVLEELVRIRLLDALEALHRLLDLRLAVFDQVLFALLVPVAAADQEGLQALDWFALPGGGYLLAGAVAAGVVGGGVVAEAVGQALDEGRPLALTGPFQRRLYAGIDRQRIVAVHLLAGHAGADGLLRQGRRTALQRARHRDGPLVVVDD